MAAARAGAGDGLLRPLSLLSLAGLLLNDHVLKAAAAGTPFSVVTGKLSDVCGVAFLPILVVAGLEIAAAAVKRFRGPSVRVSVCVAVCVAVCFCLMKTVPIAGHAFQVALGALQWPFYAVVAFFSGEATPPLRLVKHVMDATDCIAAPFAFVVVTQARVRASSWASNG